MSQSCCTCPGGGGGGGGGAAAAGLPLICLVPRDQGMAASGGGGGARAKSPSAGSSMTENFQLFDDDFLKNHFKLPPRALYLDAFRRPLITFPMSGDRSKHFNIARKNKINQMILDGFLDPSEAISAPSVFPYAKTEQEKLKEAEEEEEIIYILQLPDWEFQCPIHNQIIRTPRFIWHSCKKTPAGSSNEMKRGGGPINKPKPWILSRITDFDLTSQW